MEEKKNIWISKESLDRDSCYTMFTTSMYWKGTLCIKVYTQQAAIMISIIKVIVKNI